MKNRCALIILLLSCVGTESLAQYPDQKQPDRDMIGTSLSRKLCKPSVDDYDEEVLVCQGTADYALILKGDETKPQISLLAPDGTRHPIHYWDLSDPAFRGIEESVLWIVNTPDKTLAINFRLKIEPKDGQWGRYDVIARVSPLPVCIVGSVPVTLKTGGQSMAIAVAPAARPCLALDELRNKN